MELARFIAMIALDAETRYRYLEDPAAELGRAGLSHLRQKLEAPLLTISQTLAQIDGGEALGDEQPVGHHDHHHSELPPVFEALGDEPPVGDFR